MLRVLVGNSGADYRVIVNCREGGKLTQWVVPSDSVAGDEAVLFIPGRGFVARAVVATNPKRSTFGAGHAYRAALKNVVHLPTPVPLEDIERRLPRWG